MILHPTFFLTNTNLFTFEALQDQFLYLPFKPPELFTHPHPPTHPPKAPHLSHQWLQRGAKDVLLGAEGRQDVVEVKGGPHLAGATRQDANLTRGRRMGEDGEDDGLKESSYRPSRNL